MARPASSKRSSAKRKAPAKTKRASAPAKKAAKRGKTSGTLKSAASADRIEVRSFHSPGYRSTVDRTKYEAMWRVLRRALPAAPPGITQAEMFAAVKGKLPESAFPGQAKSEWWVKCVQLDQEARGGMKRTPGSPLRWWRA